MKAIKSIISIVFVLILGIVTSILFTIGIGIILGIEPFQDNSIVLTYGDRHFASWVIVALAFMCFWAGAFMSTRISSYISIFFDLAIYFFAVAIASLVIIYYRLNLSTEIKDLSYIISSVLLVFATVSLVLHLVKTEVARRLYIKTIVKQGDKSFIFDIAPLWAHRPKDIKMEKEEFYIKWAKKVPELPHIEMEIITLPIELKDVHLHIHSVGKRKFLCWTGRVKDIDTAKDILRLWSIGCIYTLLTGKAFEEIYDGDQEKFITHLQTEFNIQLISMEQVYLPH